MREETMTVLKGVGLAAGIGLVGIAAFLAYEPWRTHGGRFATEFLALAGAVALVGLVVLWLSW
jgi:hypothetical protein